VLTTFAVLLIAMVTGCGPQSNETRPPAATALTTAREVHEPGEPVPTTVSAEAAGADATPATSSAAARTPALITAPT
jgi:hypothetical protein